MSDDSSSQDVINQNNNNTIDNNKTKTNSLLPHEFYVFIYFLLPYRMFGVVLAMEKEILHG